MRIAEVVRETKETKVTVHVNIDGQYQNSIIETGIGFLDHMLTLLANHGRVELSIKAVGDTYVDAHHTVEDVALTLGQALAKALGNKEGINRFGTAYVPMDEALTRAVIDLSGRPYLVFQGELNNPKLGDFDTELVEDFMGALANAMAMNLHVCNLYGRNTHHIIESMFKALGRALREAVTIHPDIVGVNSTKGSL